MRITPSNLTPQPSVQGDKSRDIDHLPQTSLVSKPTAVSNSLAATGQSDFTHNSQPLSLQFRSNGRRLGSLTEIAKQAFHHHLYERRRQTDEKIKYLSRQIE
jgi:hypothetical protein